MQDSARGRHSATAAAAVTVPAAAAATVPAAVAATVPQKEESLEAMVSLLQADNDRLRAAIAAVAAPAVAAPAQTGRASVLPMTYLNWHM